MQVKNKIMYHYNNRGDRKDEWVVGKTIDNTKDYISDFYRDYLSFSPVVPTKDGGYAFFPNIIDNYLKKNKIKKHIYKFLRMLVKCLEDFLYLKERWYLNK